MKTDDKLLVCSVFGGGQLDPLWLKLQRDQLQKTGGEFTHAVFLGKKADAGLFGECTVVGRASPNSRSEHYEGLVALAEYSEQHPHAGYLILDSDAFPIRQNWEEILRDRLIHFQKDYAAVIRTENLDTFPHPCIMYSLDPRWLKFKYFTTTNLLGQTITDLRCVPENYLPLLRTNRRSVHPVLASIYFDLFYHHGCGSREFRMRATRAGYYSHIIPGSAIPETILAELQTDPLGFISNLCADREDGTGI